MTLDEAIKILYDHSHAPVMEQCPDIVEALKLGIEALKEIKHLRESQVLYDDELLPGETKD